MKCYFALTAPNDDTSPYVDMLEVALKSAHLHTSLKIVVLYDGPKGNRCWEIVQKYGAEVIEHTFSHRQYTDKIYSYENCGYHVDVDKAAGAYMRLDIPWVEKDDDYVMYADIDVLFLKDIKMEDLPKPRFLAACSEFEKSEDLSAYFNSGVMVMNVKNMRTYCSAIFESLKQGAPPYRVMDQDHLNIHCANVREWLPFEYNWKPYWGINPDAAIIHFHGMKPLGNIENSGFAMSEHTIGYMAQKPNAFSGQMYYYIKFFELLSKNNPAASVDAWAPWLAGYFEHAKDLLISTAASKLEQSVKKAQRKLFRYCMMNILTLGLTYKRNKKRIEKLNADIFRDYVDKA